MWLVACCSDRVWELFLALTRTVTPKTIYNGAIQNEISRIHVL